MPYRTSIDPGLDQSDINYRADWWENDTAELRLAGAQQCLVIISDMKHGEARGSGRSYQTIYSSSPPSPLPHSVHPTQSVMLELRRYRDNRSTGCRPAGCFTLLATKKQQNKELSGKQLRSDPGFYEQNLY